MIIDTWVFGNDGMVRQSLSDMQDSNFSLFTETAKDHNQTIIRQGAQ